MWGLVPIRFVVATAALLRWFRRFAPRPQDLSAGHRHKGRRRGCRPAAGGCLRRAGTLLSWARGRLGSRNATSRTPAAATPAATRQAPVRLCWNASTAASWRARAGPASPARLRCWEVAAAPPTEPWAAVTTRAGRPRGSRAVSRLGVQGCGDAADYGHPKGAAEQPGGPLTAEAMPPFSFGTAPMMDSVAGVWVSPMPTPSTTICAAMKPWEVARDTVEIDRRRARVPGGGHPPGDEQRDHGAGTKNRNTLPTKTAPAASRRRSGPARAGSRSRVQPSRKVSEPHAPARPELVLPNRLHLRSVRGIDVGRADCPVMH